MASSIGPSDDPVGTMMSVPTGGKGVDAICKAYQEGSDEVKDLLKYETDVIFECRYCKNLYRSIANFVAHKRQYCRSLCRSLPIYDVLSKNIEELANKLTNEKDKDKEKDKEKKKGQGKGSRVNVVTSVQRKLQTATFSDDLNRVELYTLPSIARNIPATTFEDGYQAIEHMNPFAVLKEAVPEEGALLVMPQDDSRVRPTSMTLRKKAKVDFEEKAMTGRELIVLDYIYKDILKSVNPASCQCLFAKCKDIKPFGDILTLAYHLTLQHNRRMTTQDFLKIGKGREGWFTCFLCRTVYRNYDKLLVHVNRDHSAIKQKHSKRRQMMADNSGTKAKRKSDARVQRRGSLSPVPPQSPSDDEKEDGENDEDEESTVKATNGTTSPPKQKTKHHKKKKTPKKIVQIKEESPELPPSQQVESNNEAEEENIAVEVDIEVNNEEKSEEKVKDGSPTDSTSSNGRSQSTEPIYSLASERTRRRIRRPRTLAEFALTDDEFNVKHSPLKKKQKLASNSSSNDLNSMVSQISEETQLILPKSEITDDDSFLTVEPATAISQTVSPVKALSREVLVQSIRKARTVSPVKQPTPKKSKTKESQESLDVNSWVLPEVPLPRNGTGSGSSTPSKGSGRRKQQLVTSDDVSTLLQISEDKVEPERSPSPKRRNLDLDSLKYEFVNDDEQRFFKALRMMDKANYICLECMTPFDGQEKGRRHMLSHIRVVRFRCALCDVGAFFLNDMREHLTKRYCPSLHYAPEKYIIQGNGPIIMKQEDADELIQVVHSECPGQYRYTSGRIVSEHHYVPYFPDREIELRIIGPQAAESITMSTPKKADNIRKSISIMSKPKSPMKSTTSSEVQRRSINWSTPSTPQFSNDQIPPKEAIPTPPTIRPIKLFKPTEATKNYVIVTSQSADKVVSNEQIDSAAQPGPSTVSLRETTVSQ